MAKDSTALGFRKDYLLPIRNISTTSFSRTVYCDDDIARLSKAMSLGEMNTFTHCLHCKFLEGFGKQVGNIYLKIFILNIYLKIFMPFEQIILLLGF